MATPDYPRIPYGWAEVGSADPLADKPTESHDSASEGADPPHSSPAWYVPQMGDIGATKELSTP